MLISEPQKTFIVSSIKSNVRVDGRNNSQSRRLEAKQNCLEHLPGSCQISQQSSSTTIYSGVKIRLERVSNNQETFPQMQQRINLELGCIQKLSQAQESKRALLQELLRKYVIKMNLETFGKFLHIPKAKQHYLSMHIDCYSLTIPHESQIELMFECVKSALNCTLIPSFEVNMNEVTNEETIEVIDGNQDSTAGGIRIDLELKMIGLVDEDCAIKSMSLEEYESVENCILIALRSDHTVIEFDLFKGKLSLQNISHLVKFAKQA